MKKVVLLAFLLFSLCVAGLLRLQTAYASPYTDIDVGTAYNMITNGSYPDLVVLDVRNQSEYDSGHIYGAVWIPHTELAARIGELADHKNHEIIVYCMGGARSASASDILDSNNFTKVYNMLGGITAWQSAGYPVWNATVHNVDTTFNYDTIQAAINDSDTLDGHTILVDAGIYYEHVTIDKSISLIGENRGTTVIDGKGTGNVIEITELVHVSVTGFTIRNGVNGIFIRKADNNIISGNIVTDNKHGIYLYATCGCDPTRENTIRNNTIKNNKNGIYLGVSIQNVIYHNNFIKNTKQAYYAHEPYYNVWDNDYPSGGNYWSDYEERYPDAEELDGSGIWNTTYVIDVNNGDRYPLMNPWGDVEPPVADAGPDQSVFQGMVVTFDASGSTDDVAIKSYVWNFTDVTPKTLTDIQPQYIFNNTGDFEVTLNVTDYAGKWNIDTMWVHVLLETNPPTTTDDYDDIWHTTDFTITLSATDDLSGVAETYYKINDELIQNVSAHEQPLITKESANNTLEYWSVDLNGNEEFPHQILTDIKLDKTAPVGSVTIAGGAEYATTTSVQLTLSATDETSRVANMSFSNDGTKWSDWEPYATSKSWTLSTGDGTKTVYIQFMDNAGLASETYSDTITLDTTPPTISITSPSNGTEIRSSSPTITWTGTDATSGIDHYEIRLDDGLWINVGTNTTYAFTGVGDGSHTVEVKAFDKVDCLQVAAVEFTVNTSLIGGPGYIEELAIMGVVVVIVALATAIYLLKIRKKT